MALDKIDYAISHLHTGDLVYLELYRRHEDHFGYVIGINSDTQKITLSITSPSQGKPTCVHDYKISAINNIKILK